MLLNFSIFLAVVVVALGLHKRSPGKMLLSWEEDMYRIGICHLS